MFTEEQISRLAPKPEAYTAGKSLAVASKWIVMAQSDRAIWGQIKGSGSTPYSTQIDLQDLGYKCSCPSRQFPCKHGIALLLLHCKSNFAETDEADWVKEWIDKRRAKSDTPKVEKEVTEEEQLKKDKDKEKRSDDRKTLVDAGVNELMLWLQDMVRVGLLELPNKSKQEIETMAARMVDAKAPGLAGYVRAFANLDFGNISWQEQAMTIIGKLYLLLRSWKNIDTLTPIWQESIKNLLGWSQSPKELLADENATTFKDEWLVLGEVSEEQDNLVILRQWVWACNSNLSGLMLTFGTPFSPLVSTVIQGSIIEAEIAFFPSVMPQRCVLKMQRSIKTVYTNAPKMLEDWDQFHDVLTDHLKQNPWLNNQAYLIADVKIRNINNVWTVADKHNAIMPIIKNHNEEQLINWILISNEHSVGLAFVWNSDGIKCLGIFNNGKYTVL